MKPSFYWDSDCFLAWLKKEDNKYPTCGAVLDAAEAGQIKIVTSALTLTEVLWPKGKPLSLAREDSEKVELFFRKSFIVVVDLYRILAERARQLVWDSGVRPKDAIHVATALSARVEEFHTFDEDLIKKSGQLGSPPLAIRIPSLPGTLPLFPTPASDE